VTPQPLSGLPTRNGVSPSCVVLPQGAWATVLDFLVQRFAHVSASQWQQRMQEGVVVDAQGNTLSPQTPYQANTRVYYYRALPAEHPIPFETTVLWQDAHIVVVDKPHFLPVLPSGKYLQETVLVRLKKALQNDALSPIHRIDRDTAGLVLFSANPSTRGHYQALFRQREVHKTYEAIAPWAPQLAWPMRRASRIVPSTHFMQQTEISGEPNAVTLIEPVQICGELARYRLAPITGQRHQLRVHMNALGLPIVGDGMYPTLTPEPPIPTYTNPLLLLAQQLRFVDPISGLERLFTSQRSLEFPSHATQ
jgi:tRNA pseudouridine32 synthase / 23S rRNA pseudouridine746 synthase